MEGISHLKAVETLLRCQLNLLRVNNLGVCVYICGGKLRRKIVRFGTPSLAKESAIWFTRLGQN